MLVGLLDCYCLIIAKIFVGSKSLVLDVCGVTCSSEFVNALEDVIKKRGAMDKLTSNSATVEISARVKDIFHALCINDWQSEPRYQHQNFAERQRKHLKHNMNWYTNWRTATLILTAGYSA